MTQLKQYKAILANIHSAYLLFFMTGDERDSANWDNVSIFLVFQAFQALFASGVQLLNAEKFGLGLRNEKSPQIFLIIIGLCQLFINLLNLGPKTQRLNKEVPLSSTAPS